MNIQLIKIASIAMLVATNINAATQLEDLYDGSKLKFEKDVKIPIGSSEVNVLQKKLCLIKDKKSFGVAPACSVSCSLEVKADNAKSRKILAGTVIPFRGFGFRHVERAAYSFQLQVKAGNADGFQLVCEKIDYTRHPLAENQSFTLEELNKLAEGVFQIIPSQSDSLSEIID